MRSFGTSDQESIFRKLEEVKWIYTEEKEKENGRYWDRTSGLFHRVGCQRGIPFGTRFQHPPSEPCGQLSKHTALQWPVLRESYFL